MADVPSARARGEHPPVPAQRQEAPAAMLMARRGGGMSMEELWGVIFVVPYVAVFVLFVVYPVLYGIWLGSSPSSYVQLFNDPIYFRSLWNTFIFLVLGVNIKMFLALLLSGYFSQSYRWVKWLLLIFILPWAVPAIPTFISARWMLNGQWGLINNIIWDLSGAFGPGWLTTPTLAMGSVIVFYIWKWLPFWTVIFLAGRTAIPGDLYEAAAIDGTNGFQRFRYITFPMMRNLYIICTVLSTIWTLGDYNTVHFITGGGPVLSTHILATLGIRNAFELGEPSVGVATVITALPLLIPLVIYLMRKIRQGAEQ
jgi:multiple sugar transport system permease protein